MKPDDQHRCNTNVARMCVCLLLVISSLGGQAADPTNEPLLRLEIGMHTAPISRIASDAAGRWAVTASDDKTARVWDMATGQQVQVLRPPQDAGKEGKLYASASIPPSMSASSSTKRQRATVFAAALEQIAGQIASQDVFVLYLAGHGASVDRDYHFIPWDAVYTSTDALRRRSLTHEQFRNLLAKIPATKTVLLLDTCSAGGFGRQEGRGVVEKDAIDRLSRLTGRAMIAATANEKMAIEGAGGHGAFTFVLLEGLQGKADRLPEITCKWGYEQFPFSTTEGSSFTLIPKP